MKIVYFSKGIRGATCLAHIIQAGYPVEAVIGVSPEKELESLSQQYQFPVIYPEKLNTAETEKVLKGYQPDLFILSGYNKILKSIILGIPPQGTINLHGGKLPEYRGAAPINWQIINGETTGGCSIIYVDEGIDTGDIIAQEHLQNPGFALLHGRTRGNLTCDAHSCAASLVSDNKDYVN